MQPAVLIRLQPLGPWRYGPGEGGFDQLDSLYRSDRLYSAVTLAMKQLGFLDEWLDATARASTPAVVFSSLFPFQADVLFAPPPATLWPPPSALVTAPSPVFLTKLRWSAARFVPLSLIESILLGENVLADQWIPDPESGCLLRRDRPTPSPFRAVTRTAAAVDRITRAAVHVTLSACVEFEPGSGLWTIARYADAGVESTWSLKLESAFRLLADTGFGARRSSGWGRSEVPQFQTGSWPALLTPKLSRSLRTERQSPNGDTGAPVFWLLSLYSPSPADAIDWKTGQYQFAIRGGRVEGALAAEKKSVHMVSEGSVLASDAEPIGTAVDVAPDGFAHPVYRCGFAFVLKLPTPRSTAETEPVETPSDPDALESRPCDQPEPAPVNLEPEPTTNTGEPGDEI